MIRELAPSDDLEMNEVFTTAAPSENSKLHEDMYAAAVWTSLYRLQRVYNGL